MARNATTPFRHSCGHARLSAMPALRGHSCHPRTCQRLRRLLLPAAAVAAAVQCHLEVLRQARLPLRKVLLRQGRQFLVGSLLELVPTSALARHHLCLGSAQPQEIPHKLALQCRVPTKATAVTEHRAALHLLRTLVDLRKGHCLHQCPRLPPQLGAQPRHQCLQLPQEVPIRKWQTLKAMMMMVSP